MIENKWVFWVSILGSCGSIVAMNNELSQDYKQVLSKRRLQYDMGEDDSTFVQINVGYDKSDDLNDKETRPKKRKRGREAHETDGGTLIFQQGCVSQALPITVSLYQPVNNQQTTNTNAKDLVWVDESNDYGDLEKQQKKIRRIRKRVVNHSKRYRKRRK